MLNNTFAEIVFPALTRAAPLAELFRLMFKQQFSSIVRYDVHEPIRQRFDFAKCDNIAESLMRAQSVYWRGTGDLASGEIGLSTGRGKQTGSLSIWTAIERLGNRKVITDLVESIGSTLKATYGYVHYLSKPEVKKGYAGNTVHGNADDPPFMCVTRWQLVRCLPDLYWANIFGPEYVALFGGRERVAATPAKIVRELAPDTFYIQLTDNLLDFETCYDEAHAIRERAKQHLGSDCFFDYVAGFTRTYQVPNLGWEEPVRQPLTPDAFIASLRR